MWCLLLLILKISEERDHHTCRAAVQHLALHVPQLLGVVTEQECVIMTLRAVLYFKHLLRQPVPSASHGFAGLWRTRNVGEREAGGKLLLVFVTPTHA